MMLGYLDGRRSRGRPRCRWTDGVMFLVGASRDVRQMQERSLAGCHQKKPVAYPRGGNRGIRSPPHFSKI